MLAHEIGRLAKGYSTTNGINKFLFVPIETAPHNKKAAYLRFFGDIREHKEQKHHVKMIVANQNVDYPDDVGTPTAKMITAKISLNSTLSTPNEKVTTFGIKKMYLQTVFDSFKYMKILCDIIREEIK